MVPGRFGWGGKLGLSPKLTRRALGRTQESAAQGPRRQGTLRKFAVVAPSIPDAFSTIPDRLSDDSRRLSDDSRRLSDDSRRPLLTNTAALTKR
jgi:hypothetical protein